MTIPITLSTILIVSPAVLAAIGVGLSTHASVDWLLDVGTSLRRRWSKQVLITVAADEGATLSIGRESLTFSWLLLLPAMGGIALAGSWRHPLLSTWAVVLGIAGTVLGYRSQARRTTEDRALQELFLSALCSRYGVTQSLRRTLEGVLTDLSAEDTPLGQALAETIRLLNAGEPVEQAVQPLRDQSEIMRRLATILTHAHQSTPEETRDLLQEIAEQARKKRRLAERAKIALTVTRTTLKVLIVAVTTAVFLAAILPAWRRHYQAQPMSYIVASGIALVGVLYFRFRIKDLEDSL